MSRTTLNPEDLTFEEWICAAGYACGFIAHPESWPYDFRGGNPETGYIVTSYPMRLRQAWRQGEDPTEYR